MTSFDRYGLVGFASLMVSSMFHLGAVSVFKFAILDYDTMDCVVYTLFGLSVVFVLVALVCLVGMCLTD